LLPYVAVVGRERSGVLGRVLFVLATVAACGDGTASPPRADPSGPVVPEEGAVPARSAGTSSLPASAGRAERDGKVLADAAGLESLLNDFWREELLATYQISFDVPDAFLFYRGGGNQPCGPNTDAYPSNATYCPVPGDEKVQFDLDWFSGYLVDHPGGATTFLVLAHEWGHAVQDTWLETGGTDVWDPANRRELNADCLAGVFLGRSIRDGTILEELGDADAIYRWLRDEGGEWLGTPPSHGTSQERRDAFDDGYGGTTRMCRTRY
jgi:uncharacterized protein